MSRLGILREDYGGLQMVVLNEGESLRQKSLDFLWMQNRDWTGMAEEGDPLIFR